MHKKSQSPIFCLADGTVRGILAVVIRTQGPSYRSVGATMVFTDDGSRLGSLSSGCIESDLAIHAQTVRTNGVPLVVTYGRGSPFMDIELPCGGGLDILLIPQPTDAELDVIASVKRDRKQLTISISKTDGAISAVDQTFAGTDDLFVLSLNPPLQFCIFGKGPEAANFALLAQALGYDGTLLSPDPETLDGFAGDRWDSVLLSKKACPADLNPDAHTAVVLFFHDHDWEAPLLRDLLQSDAFYIGAQGSKRAGEARTAELQALGVPQEQCNRIVGPIGMIPSTRDPQTLAVSVMAEILNKAQSGFA
ncbi:MAG: XdhC family protein [Yoonia sp.]|nr:XdhC family protein [Yoonia sp.]